MADSPGELNRPDLDWAAALARGDAEAIERYELEIVPATSVQLRRRGYTIDEIAEVQQQLRMRLLVGGDGRPAILGYQGRGRLMSWVLVAALREAIRQRDRRRREPAVEDDALLALVDRTISASDPDKQRYREMFGEALKVALGKLSARDRNVLRMYAFDALSVDQIGAILGVHRATAARWLAGAREAVAHGMRQEVMRELGADRFETESLMRWVRSQIDMSLGGLGDDESSA
jgi:RNA polymerase sigma-70 factor, ECF subfamily